MSRRNFFMVIVVERDIDDPFQSNGAIVMEQYTRVDHEEVMERAQRLAKSGKYGRVWVTGIDYPDLMEVRPDANEPPSHV